jgi:hypothetical protein
MGGRRSRHVRPSQPAAKSAPSRKIVIWSEKGFAMMAYQRPGNRGLISIRQFPTETARSKFILGLGNREVDRQLGDPRAIRARLLSLFNHQRKADDTPLRLVDAHSERAKGPIVAVLWSCMDGPDDRLLFMLATGSGAQGLEQVRRFNSEAERQRYLSSLSGTVRLVEINILRRMPASDLEEIIRAKAAQPRPDQSNDSQSTQPVAKQRDPAPRGARSRPGRLPETTSRLAGKALLNKVRELDGCSKSELVRQCGYIQRRSDGSLRLNYTSFFQALLEAKQADEKDRARPGKRQSRPTPVVIDNPAGLKSDDLLRVPEGRQLNPAAQARRQEMAEFLRQQEEKQEQRRRRKEERLAERRRLLGLDEPDSPEDMMRIAIRAGAPGSKR